MRILHLADVHLDTAFTGRSADIRSRLRQATREAFRSAVQLAVDEGVHAVLIAGDLFDSHRLSFETEGFLVAELKRLVDAGIAVVYCTGNHDPGSGRRSRRPIPWPDGVHVVDGPEPVHVAVRDSEGREIGGITAAGHATERVTEDLAARLSPPDGALPRVALLHAQVVGSRSAGEHEPYAPAELAHMQRAGFDYWALGHIHRREILSDFPAVCYPGNLQGRSPRETGAKGAVLVDVVRGMPATVHFRPLAPVRWESLEVRDPADAVSREALVSRIQEAWREAREADPDPGAEWMVRVQLAGATPLWRELDSREEVAGLAEELAHRLDALEVELRVDGVHAPVDPDEHRDREDVLGQALRLLAEVRSGEATLPGVGDELFGPGGGGELSAYLERILAGADGELASRLLARGDDP